jgi:diaminohydroxyphosphoribosylaminopyrimidine deaminase / 5-amino-6-(5-phosphoribosylamino)uracil reductase
VHAPTRIAHDHGWLARAVAVAERARGRTSPNPAVGCVLVRDDELVGEGATAPAGGPHAEVLALEVAGAQARGATAYVTLEPCAHHGRTPPCADALVEAGIVRVVYAHPDPNPPATGGARVLASHGVEVVGPEVVGERFRATVAAQLEGFLTVVRRRRPHLTLKLAQTADGRLTAPNGARWITGPTARRAVHRWRAAMDAVLVGVGTVLADDPRLDVRHGVHVARRPRPVVLDTRLRTPVDAAVARPGGLVLCGPGADRSRRADLEAAGVEVVVTPIGDGGRLDLPAALATLADQGINTVLAEPGDTLARALLALDLVDRVVLHVGLHLGDGPLRWVVPVDPTWVTERVGGAGPDLIVHHARPSHEPPIEPPIRPRPSHPPRGEIR